MRWRDHVQGPPPAHCVAIQIGHGPGVAVPPPPLGQETRPHKEGESAVGSLPWGFRQGFLRGKLPGETVFIETCSSRRHCSSRPVPQGNVNVPFDTVHFLHGPQLDFASVDQAFLRVARPALSLRQALKETQVIGPQPSFDAELLIKRVLSPPQGPGGVR